MTADEKMDALGVQVQVLTLEVARFTAAHPPTLELINANIDSVGVKVDGVNKRFDLLNGRVKRIELWKAGIVVAIMVLSSIGGYFVREGISRMDSVYTFMLEHRVQTKP